ncbi:MAG TPA: DegT/DnrJ/EryC1/StrS family aminotransferase [Bacteroidales bacterium]|nr:DegT/DnrJ/EryC1/StrS family aminotransferase [Bacteroidales bacterium]
MNVPFNDLTGLHSGIRAEIDNAIAGVIESSGFVLSRQVSEFETAFAAKLGVKHCIGVGNGTDALVVCLKMAGVGAGNEVIIPANTFIAGSEAISLCGATPVFVDHNRFYTIDTEAIEARITSRTKAILPVHLYGQAADMENIVALGKKHNIPVIEDCAQSHFASCNGKYTGSFGFAGCYSFYPGKNLGALGDGGCIVTNDDNLALRIRMYCNHGSAGHLKHSIEGSNSRLDAIQAAVLNVKLRYIDAWNAERNRIARLYENLLESCREIELPITAPGNYHIFHLYVIAAKRRDELKDYLLKCGVQTGLHYEKALPFTPCYAGLKHQPDEFPVSFKNQSRLLSLPIYPNMSDEQAAYVAQCILDFYY